MSSQSYVESVGCATKEMDTSSKHHGAKPEQKSREEEHYLPGMSVCVAPLPKTLSREDLVKFLHKFGIVKRQHFSRNSFWIEYDNSKPVDMLMSRSDWLANETLHLRRLKKTRGNLVFEKEKLSKQKNANGPARIEVNEENDPLSYDCIKNVVENEVTFNNQLSALLNTVQLTENELMTRYNVICPHLDEIFRSIFPECRSFSFGSTVAQLSFKESDLDIYMYVGHNELPVDLSMYTWTSMIFKKVRKVMYSLQSVFANIISIPNAKTPIIKFRYLPTNISCDISFKNSLGIYKSQFMRYCASRDPRIRPLMLLLKYWARHYGIAGSGRISSYGLVCLIIFYLQQESVGLLPTMLTLQKTCAPYLVCGWQVNFNEATPLPAITNDSSVATLLHNFFLFYANFNFNSSVICLLDGKVHSESSFYFDNSLPSYMHRYKNGLTYGIRRLDTLKPAVIQDPIELNQNPAASTSNRALIAFQNCCECSANMCSTVSEKNYDNLLTVLFGGAPLQFLPAKRKKKRFRTLISPDQFVRVGLPADFETRTDITDKEKYISDNWYFIIFNLIKDIFVMVFKLEVEMLLDDHEAKQQKINVISDVYIQNQQKISFRCTGNKCIWNNRKKYFRALDLHLSFIEKEAHVSDKILKLMNQNDETNNVRLDFICTVEKMNNTTAVDVLLVDENSQVSDFRQFNGFLQQWIPNIINRTMAYMLQYNKTYQELFHHEESL